VYRTALVALLLSLGTVVAAPAPFPREKRQPPVLNLAGMTWAGDGPDAPTTYYFDPNGTLTYSYSKRTYSNGTWKQDGKRVFWEANRRYYQFEGTIAGDTITGTGWNQAGWKGQLRIQPAKSTR
jgi:hypothetical protein